MSQEDMELLVIDVGNTTIKLALTRSKKIFLNFSLPSRLEETEDSLGLEIWELVNHAGKNVSSIKACVISSVVPGLDTVLRGAVEKYIGCPVLFAGRDLPIPIKNNYPRPEETGVDRLIGAFAASRLFPKTDSLLVVDFGTAVTFDSIYKNSYLGGLIFPGPGVAATALAKNTAKLPEISLELISDEPMPCVDTQTSIQHGIIFGYKYLVEGLCNNMKGKLPGPVKIIGTGSFARTLEKISDLFDYVAPSLMLDGLSELYYTQISASAC